MVGAQIVPACLPCPGPCGLQARWPFLSKPRLRDAVSRNLVTTAAHVPSTWAHFFPAARSPPGRRLAPCALLWSPHQSPGWQHLELLDTAEGNLSVLASSCLASGPPTSTLSPRSLRTRSPSWQDDLHQNTPFFYLLRCSLDKIYSTHESSHWPRCPEGNGIYPWNSISFIILFLLGNGK